MVRVVQSEGRPAPKGHYSPGTRSGSLVFVSGQLPIDSIGVPRPELTVEAQVDLALGNLDAVLRASGTTRDKVLKVNVFITDIALWDRVDERYAAFFGAHRPARAVVPVGPLHYGCVVEIDAVAEC